MKKELGKFFGENKAEQGHARSSLRGGVFSIASRGISVLVQVGSQVVLMRILTREDVGLVAMVATVTGLAPVLMDLGTRDAAVQKPKITEEEVSALFWLTVGIGGILALLLVGFSGLIASFYNHEPRLEGIALVSAISFIVSAASCQHSALLRRAMMFREIALMEVASGIFSSIAAIGIALAGGGYWALVAKPILASAYTLGSVAWYCRWLPGLPRLTQSVKEMLKFGLNVTGFTLTDYVGRSADMVCIGKFLGPTIAGSYKNAYFFYDNTLGLLSISLHAVAVSSLSKLRDNVDELKRSWSKALSSLAFFAMPAFALLAVTGEDWVVLLGGEKWREAGLLVSVLALRGIPHVVERTLGWLHVPAGRADRWMRWGVIASLAQLVALGCGLPFGTTGVAIAYVLAMYLIFVPAIAYAGQPFGIGARDVIRAVGPQLLAAVSAAGYGFMFGFWLPPGLPPIVRIAVLGAFCGVAYLVIAVGLLNIRMPLQVGGSLLVGFLPKRFVAIPWVKRLAR